MEKFEEFIKSDKIYEYTWLKYYLYSSTCYKLLLDYSLYIIINEKEDYSTMKSNYMAQLYIESGHAVDKLYNLDIDKKRLKCINIRDVIGQL